MTRPIFNHIFVQDLQEGETALLCLNYSTVTSSPRIKMLGTLSKVVSITFTQGEWEVLGRTFDRSHLIKVRYQTNELVAVQV